MHLFINFFILFQTYEIILKENELFILCENDATVII